MSHIEHHKSHRVGWLRAAVLGANDGIVSTASLIIGVAAANTSRESILLSGIAGLAAGALSMAAGEYVSVSSQSDTEKADLALERKALKDDFDSEINELADIYEKRGVDSVLAQQVAKQLMTHDALGAHARDEIGISKDGNAKPFLAAFSSAGAFTVGATLPLLVAWATPVGGMLIWLVAFFSLAFLAILGGLAARAGGASIVTGAIRVSICGTLAMALTAGVGKVFDVAL